MDLNIKLPTPEEINQQITDAIAKSAIGEALKKHIEKAVEHATSQYNNPYEQIIRQEVGQCIARTIREQYSATIAERVKIAVDKPEFIDALVKKVVMQAMAS